MMVIAWIILQIIVLYLLADFVAGIFHWAEDTLGADDTPVWGPLFAAPNSIHHDCPREMMKIHWIPNNAALVGLALVTVGIAWALGGLTWQLLVFAVIGGFSQQAHRFSHGSRLEMPGFVKLLQRIGVLQDARHHWIHHTHPHTTRYCVVTPWVNPVLDRISFWRGMERVFVPVFGAPRRPDLRDKSWYRDRAIWDRGQGSGA